MLETVDFNQVISENISVVAGFISGDISSKMLITKLNYRSVAISSGNQVNTNIEYNCIMFAKSTSFGDKVSVFLRTSTSLFNIVDNISEMTILSSVDDRLKVYIENGFLKFANNLLYGVTVQLWILPIT